MKTNLKSKWIFLIALLFFWVLSVSTTNPTTALTLYINVLSPIVVALLFVSHKSLFLKVIGAVSLGSGIERVSTHLAMDVMGKEKTLKTIESTWRDSSFAVWLISLILILVVGTALLWISFRKVEKEEEKPLCQTRI